MRGECAAVVSRGLDEFAVRSDLRVHGIQRGTDSPLVSKGRQRYGQKCQCGGAEGRNGGAAGVLLESGIFKALISYFSLSPLSLVAQSPGGEEKCLLMG